MCLSKLGEVLEKVLKAELIRLGWFLVKTHDLEKLANELASRGSDLTAAAKPLCTSLAEVHFSERYPGFDLEDPNWPDLRAKIDQVSALLETIKARLTEPGGRGQTGVVAAQIAKGAEGNGCLKGVRLGGGHQRGVATIPLAHYGQSAQVDVGVRPHAAQRGMDGFVQPGGRLALALGQVRKIDGVALGAQQASVKAAALIG